jgi:PAS domain S-box-containing protein
MTSRPALVTEHEELARRLRLERGLADCSRLLLGATHSKDALTRALVPLVEAVGISRAYVFENFEDSELGTCMRQVAEVCAAGIEPQLDNPELQRVPYQTVAPRWRDEMLAGRAISGRVETFPPEEQEVLRPQGILSLLTVPIWSGGRWHGFVGLDDCVEPRDWCDRDVRLLEVLAEMIGTHLDLRRESARLHESEAKYRTLFEDAAEAVLLLTDSIVDCNGRACHLWDHQREQILGRHPIHFSPPLQPDGCASREIFARHLAAARAGQPQLFYWRFLGRDNAPVDTDVSLACVTLGERSLVQAVIRDVTSRRLAEEASRRLEERARQAQKLESLGVLAGGIAHDFNNLLTVILGNAGLIRQALSEEPEGLCYVEAVETAAQRAAELCRQMLAYAGKGRYVIQRLDLGRLAEETARFLKTAFPRNTALEFHLAKDLPPIEGDGMQIRQVLVNLLTNAAEALGPDGGTIVVSTAAVELGLGRPAGREEELPDGLYTSIEVSDTGCGMDPEIQKRIFEPFFSTKFTGRGMGLSAVLGILRSHRGTVQVTTQPGHGTSFRVLLPATLRVAESEGLPAPAAKPVLKRSGTILLVDDEEGVRRLTERFLKEAGYRVLTAASGRVAIDLFADAPDVIDCVLLDLTMPEMGGGEVFEALRRIRPQLRVVLSSGYGQTEAFRMFGPGAPAGFVQKPFSRSQLHAELDRVLASARN